jgi:type IV secretory pathway VirB2 component (pilin)
MVNFLTYPIFKDIILPFLFVFVLFFAILEKSKLLGNEKGQINAIISFVVAGILISYANAVGIITKLTVFMAVALVILFVFMLIYAFAYGNTDGNPLNAKLKILIGTIAFIAVVIAVLIITDYWGKVYDFFSTSTIGLNIIFIILIAAAIAAVLFGGKTGKD